MRRLAADAENVVHHPPWWRRLPSRWRRHHAQQSELTRRADDQLLASLVQDIIVELGLTQTNYSISGGYTLHVPQVVSLVTGSRSRVDIRILHSQTPEDFAAHATAIAHRLDVAGVRVVPLGSSMVRLELLPKQG
ncbi:MAG: hypothetical protein ACRDTX_11330 [Pseudonocardiaceae bacterium]